MKDLRGTTTFTPGARRNGLFEQLVLVHMIKQGSAQGLGIGEGV